jgi:hypothetical protein
MNISDNSGGTAGEAYTEISLIQYRGNQTVSETPLVVTSSPNDTTVYTVEGANLQTHLGIDPATPGSELWNGYVGNIVKYDPRSPYSVGGYVRTNYQVSFTVDTPAIPPVLRNDRVLTKSVSYNINIPNDTTAYESYG